MEKIMFLKMSRFFNILFRRHSEKQNLSLYLDEIASERLERLRRKLKTLNDSQIIGLSLKALESKTDRIIKMHITKKAPELKMEGLSDEAIADYFNRLGIPVPAGKDRWDSDLISSFIKEREENRSSH